ncbi:hypothetical protein R3W88_031936 [Solanum pinnatisectum]|uniref:RNase H type-1 domain-containing protein n=1 Tax=Solanum pinnatisectum TaxID=50273 RepID=A0AAV9LPP5_9SOLN|nr:hypothetical protein R3W88_031936 [Solanum pinnatisectum]
MNNHEFHNKIHQLCCTNTTTLINSHQSVPTTILTPFILWNIWKNKNNRLFKNKNAHGPGINIQNISFSALEFYYLDYCPLSNSLRCTIVVQWHRLPVGFIKLNIDGSFDSNTNNGGTGGVLRNHMGDWITGFTCKVRVKNAHQAESLALLHGLNLAKSKTMKCLMIETDSQVLLNSLNSNNSLLSHIYSDCRSLLLQMELQQLKHVPWEANRVADILAVHGKKSMDPGLDINLIFFYASPSFVTKELDRDAMRTVTYRSVPLLYD